MPYSNPGLFLFIVVGSIVACFVALYFIGRSERQERERAEQGIVEAPSTGLSFGGVVGAVIIGNFITSLLGAIVWVLLIKAAD